LRRLGRRTLRPGRDWIGRPFDIERRLARWRGLLIRPECIVGPESKIRRIIGRRHDRNGRHGLWPELDDARFELSVNAPKQWTDIEIEQRAVGVHDAASLGPRRQRIESALLERLHHVGTRA
jgi:hypothetical protein